MLGGRGERAPQIIHYVLEEESAQMLDKGDFFFRRGICVGRVDRLAGSVRSLFGPVPLDGANGQKSGTPELIAHLVGLLRAEGRGEQGEADDGGRSHRPAAWPSVKTSPAVTAKLSCESLVRVSAKWLRIQSPWPRIAR